MLHHVASYHGLRVLNHFQFIAQRSIYFSLPALENWPPFGSPMAFSSLWCFLVVFRCWTSRRKLASRPCFIVHDLHMTWSHFLKFLWSRWHLHFNYSALFFFIIFFFLQISLCFFVWQEEVRVLSKFRHPNLVILMGFAKNGSMTSVDEPSSTGWASPSHPLRPGRLLVYEHLGGGDVFNRLQKCTCDNAGSSVCLNNIWNKDLIL